MQYPYKFEKYTLEFKQFDGSAHTAAPLLMSNVNTAIWLCGSSSRGEPSGSVTDMFGKRQLDMDAKNAAAPIFVLMACFLMGACTTVDKFTIRDISNGESTSLGEPLALKESCKYAAGADISGKLSPGPIQPAAIASPAPSNSNIREAIYLIQIGDLPLQGEKGGYDIASFIGVRKDGSFVPNLLLHSDMPGASPFVNESVRIRFTPENCHFSMEAENPQ